MRFLVLFVPAATASILIGGCARQHASGEWLEAFQCKQLSSKWRSSRDVVDGDMPIFDVSVSAHGIYMSRENLVHGANALSSLRYEGFLNPKPILRIHTPKVATCAEMIGGLRQVASVYSCDAWKCVIVQDL